MLSYDRPAKHFTTYLGLTDGVVENQYLPISRHFNTTELQFIQLP